MTKLHLFILTIALIVVFNTNGSCQNSSKLEDQIASLGLDLSAMINKSTISKIAITEFLDLNGDSLHIGKYISDEVGIALIINSQKYEVVERSRLSTILKEQVFGSSIIVNDSSRVKLGNIYGVEAIIFGTITVFEESLRLTVRMVNTETGALITARAIDLERNNRVNQLLNGANQSVPPKNPNNNVTAKPKTEQEKPKCELNKFGELEINNNTTYQIKVVPTSSQSGLSPLMAPHGESITYYEAPVGILEFDVQLLVYGTTMIRRTIPIQVKIEQCKTTKKVINP